MIKLVPSKWGTICWVGYFTRTLQVKYWVYYIYKNLEGIKQSATSGALKQMSCHHKNGILKRKTKTLLFKLRFVSDKQPFPLKKEIIIPYIKVTYFTIYFSQYINFHKISHHISLWILAVSKDNPILQNMHTYKFTKYTFSHLRVHL